MVKGYWYQFHQYNRVLEKGKVPETELNEVTCPKVVEGKFAFEFDAVSSQVHINGGSWSTV